MLRLRERLPFWLAGPEATKAADGVETFWARVEASLEEALAQADVSTCSAKALEVHARDRGIARFPGEPESLWRARVRHAFITARESGSLAGLEAILAAYGAIGASLLERQPEDDWDVIQVRLDPDALDGATTPLLEGIFREWGRLCRRYLFTHLVPTDARYNTSPAQELHHVETAS